MGFLVDTLEQTNRSLDTTICNIAAGSYRNMLDLGCGDGTLTIRLASTLNVGEVHGVELEADRADQARSRGVKVEESDLNQPFPYPDNSFNLIHSNQAIEHLANTDGFLSEIRRVLTLGGTAVVCTNNLSSWHNIASLIIGDQPMPAQVSGEVIVGNRFNPLHGTGFTGQGDAHLRIFTMRAFRELAEHHGLKVERMVGVGYYPLRGWSAHLAARLDRRHSAFLVARLAI